MRNQRRANATRRTNREHPLRGTLPDRRYDVRRLGDLLLGAAASARNPMRARHSRSVQSVKQVGHEPVGRPPAPVVWCAAVPTV